MFRKALNPTESETPPQLLLERVSVRAAQAQEYVTQLIEEARKGDLVDGYKSAGDAAKFRQKALETVVPYMAQRLGGLLADNYRFSASPVRNYTAVRLGGEHRAGLALESVYDCSCRPDIDKETNPQTVGIVQKTGYCTPLHHGMRLKSGSESIQQEFFDLIPDIIQSLPEQLQQDADPAILEQATTLLVQFSSSAEELERIQKKYLSHSPHGLSHEDLEMLNMYQVASGKRIDPISWLALVNLAEQRMVNQAALEDAANVLINVVKTVAPGKSTKVDKVFYAVDKNVRGDYELFRTADKWSTPYAINPYRSAFSTLRELVGNAQAICTAFGLRDVSLSGGKAVPRLEEQLSMGK